MAHHDASPTLYGLMRNSRRPRHWAGRRARAARGLPPDGRVLADPIEELSGRSAFAAAIADPGLRGGLLGGIGGYSLEY